MDTKTIENVCKQVYRRFPEVTGSRPRVQQQAAANAAPKDSYLFIFKGSGTTADGHSIARVVRVVVSQEGKILKTSTSR